MLDLLGGVMLGMFLLGLYVAILFFYRRSTTHLALCVSDSCTEVFDIQGSSLLKVPNKIIYILQGNKLRLVTIGQTLNDLNATHQRREIDLRELDLVSDQEANTERFDGVWGAFLPFCCLKARQILGKRWSPLNVTVAARTSNILTNQKLRDEVRHKSLRFFGKFEVL